MLSSSLLATAALANARAGHHSHIHKSHSKSKAVAANENGDLINSTINGITSGTWAGAVLVTEGGVSSVSGEFIVPNPKAPAHADPNTEYCASVWVGIDGDSSSCGQAILQTGIDVCIKNGKPSYAAWYEWWPALDSYFDNFHIEAGHKIHASVHAISKSIGFATLVNLSTGQVATFPWAGNVEADLCQLDAEWIVEDYSSADGDEVPFVDFGEIKWTSAQATVGGAIFGPEKAELWDISQNGKTLAHTSINNNDVVISYAA